jgi:hypothetical protein
MIDRVMKVFGGGVTVELGLHGLSDAVHFGSGFCSQS